MQPEASVHVGNTTVDTSAADADAIIIHPEEDVCNCKVSFTVITSFCNPEKVVKPNVLFVALEAVIGALKVVFPEKVESPATVPPSVKFKLLSIKSPNCPSVGLSPVLK